MDLIPWGDTLTEKLVTRSKIGDAKIGVYTDAALWANLSERCEDNEPI